MSRGNIFFAGALVVVMALAFSAGRMNGLRNAPEYIAAKRAERARLNAEIAAADVEYQGSRQSVCDQVFDLILDHLTTETEGPTSER